MCIRDRDILERLDVHGLAYLLDGARVQRDVFVLVGHVPAHRLLELRVFDRRQGKIVADAVRVLLAIEVQVQHQAMQHRIRDDVAMQARLDSVDDHQPNFMKQAPTTNRKTSAAMPRAMPQPRSQLLPSSGGSGGRLRANSWNSTTSTGCSFSLFSSSTKPPCWRVSIDPRTRVDAG